MGWQEDVAEPSQQLVFEQQSAGRPSPVRTRLAASPYFCWTMSLTLLMPFAPCLLVLDVRLRNPSHAAECHHVPGASPRGGRLALQPATGRPDPSANARSLLGKSDSSALSGGRTAILHS